MHFSSTFVLTLATFLGSVTSTPITLHNNGSFLLEQRATPTTLTAGMLTNMKYYVQHAAAAYCNSETSLVGSKISCGSSACPAVAANSVTNYAYLGFDQSQVEGYVGIDSANKAIVISYKGSKSFANFVADLLVPKESCSDLVSGCKLHQGFSYAWGDVKSNTMAAVKKAKAAYPSYTIVLTGHSLGGAVATIAAAYLRKAGYPCDIYSYGSPRVGNEAFVNFVSAQAGAHYRVTHTDDPVPRYPGRILGFYHTSPEFWLSTGSAKTTSYALSDIKVCTGTTNGNCNAGTSSVLFTSHSYYFQDVSVCS
ncbi:lipase [Leptodontidium sp. MPI-SDFR-AT-0119]|nr:lipase [Leptodontidium sp. MPI-SDFR-AT-0119]